ncbi:BnaC07g48350D, partial [Brassica napus]
QLRFDWASRLVHYMLGFQLDIKKKYELWSLFENLTGLNCEYIEDLERPHCVKIIAAFERCEGWSRDDRMRLAKYSTPTRVQMDSVKGRDISSLQGRKGRIQFKEAILSQTRVINFVQKNIGEMFPKWEFDVEDTPAENIIKLMFVKKPWNHRPAKKKVASEEASEEAAAVAKDIKTMFKDIVDAMREGFGTCLKEIKYLSERVEAVEKKLKTLPLHLNRRSNPGQSLQNKN